MRIMINDPKVSIGLPVYNGENFLAQAIESVLSQSFTDFELIISDNGSSDGTYEIGLEYSHRDSRVRFFRVDKNIGAARNFNRVFELSSAIYFKWMAHDDLIAPNYLEKCIAALDEHPDAVIAYPLTTVIDGTGSILQEYSHYIRTDSRVAHIRFCDLLFESDQCYEIFGLIRSEYLRRTGVMGNFGHADGVLLANLSLMGYFHQIPERLFFSRNHSKQSIKVHNSGDQFGRPDYNNYTYWFDPDLKDKIILPNWRILSEYSSAVIDSGISFKDTIHCYYYLLKWIKRHRSYLYADLRTAVYRILSSYREVHAR